MAHLKALGSDDVDKAAIYSHDEESSLFANRGDFNDSFPKSGIEPKNEFNQRKTISQD